MENKDEKTGKKEPENAGGKDPADLKETPAEGGDQENKTGKGAPGSHEQVYDSAFKEILNLSPRLLIMIINGLFGTNYPLHSQVTLEANENVSAVDMDKSISDAYIRIVPPGESIAHTYVVEFMSYHDATLSLRIFQYVFEYARRNEHYVAEKGRVTLNLPEAVELYLYEGPQMEDQLECCLSYKGEIVFSYPIPVIKFLGREFAENAEQLFPLLPFEVLRFQKKLKQGAADEDVERLEKHMEAIDRKMAEACSENTISAYELETLRSLMAHLYKHAYRNLKSKGSDQMLQFSAPNIPDALKREQQLILERDALRWKTESLEAKTESLEAEREKDKAELEEYRKRYGPLTA